MDLRVGMIRAIALGFVVLVAALGALGLAIWFRAVSEPFMMLLSVSPGFAAFASSWAAPRRKFLVGLTQAPLWAVLATLANAGWAIAGGTTDFPGGGGALWLFTVALLGGLVPAAIGGAAGMWLGKARVRRSNSATPR